MFAASRIDRVKGRIKCLIDSIKTINGAKTNGEPSGTKCAALSLKFLTHPIRKKEDQKITPILIVINGWAVGLKTKGNKPIKLIVIK